MQNGRMGWDKYFLEILNALSMRGTCNRGKCSCIFTKDNQILATGYVGAPSGFPHCIDDGDIMEERIRFIDPNNPHAQKVDHIPKDWIFNEEKKRFESLPKQHCIRTVHAEANAIVQAAKRGVSLKDSTLYVSMTPCRNCALLLLGLEIKRIVCVKKYHAGQESEEMFKKAGIELDFVCTDIEDYK